MQHDSGTQACVEVLTSLLDRLDRVAESEMVSIRSLIEASGTRSFATPMLIFALISVSPLSTVPGVTSMVALLFFILAAQMIVGRRHVWLPEPLGKREFSGSKLRKVTPWLRKPLRIMDHLLRPRLVFLTERPFLILWLLMVLGLTLVMPFMELFPGTGTIASAFIALVAAAILTRDGVLILLAGFCLGLLIWLMRVVLGELF